MNPLDVQMGGSHYKRLPYQPVVLITNLDLNFIQGNVVKYVSRYKNKNGKEDLRKAMHYAQLGQKLNPRSFVLLGEPVIKELNDYVEQNKFDTIISRLLIQVVYQNWLLVGELISNLVKKYE